MLGSVAVAATAPGPPKIAAIFLSQSSWESLCCWVGSVFGGTNFASRSSALLYTPMSPVVFSVKFWYFPSPFGVNYHLASSIGHNPYVFNEFVSTAVPVW